MYWILFPQMMGKASKMIGYRASIQFFHLRLSNFLSFQCQLQIFLLKRDLVISSITVAQFFCQGSKVVIFFIKFGILGNTLMVKFGSPAHSQDANSGY